jgi:hypothetical protein
MINPTSQSGSVRLETVFIESLLGEQVIKLVVIAA